MFSKHLTFDEWPYRCPVCGYSHYDYNNFKKHPQWYSLHSALKGSSSVLLPTSADIREESRVVFSMIRQLSLEDSAAHWEKKRRVNTLAQVRPPAPVALRTILPCTFPPSGAPATKPVCVVPVVTPTDVPARLPGVPAADVPAGPGVPAVEEPASLLDLPITSSSMPVVPSKEDVDILTEFLVFEDTSEFDTESPPRTREIGTNTSPYKDEVSRLKEIVERQERALRNNTSVILDLQRLLRDKLDDPDSRHIHLGPGEGERPQTVRRKKSPPPPAVKSVVYQPARQRPRPRSPSRTSSHSSPLQHLFSPDRKTRRF
jgi:hypothetical protein